MRLDCGQSLIESCMVIALLCLLLMGLFQLSQLFLAKEVINYAAGRGARAKTVGFNDFMVFKTVRLGIIPNAGLMITPESTEGGPIAQWALERPRMPLYLSSESYERLSSILDYEDYNAIHYNWTEQASPSMLTFNVYHEFPLRFPFHRAFYASDTISLEGVAYIDNHYPLYLDTQAGGGP